MSNKDDIESSNEGLIDHVEAFSETFLKLALTTVTKKAIDISSVLFNTIIIYVAAIFTLLFAAAGLAWWIGDMINSRAAGFFIVAGFFLVVTVFIILMRKKIIYPFIRNIIVRKVYE